MIISIASGKGGAGKTTIAVNLAASIKNNVQLLDCDVEEPNSHIFLRPEFKNEEHIFVPVPKVDMEKCNLCGECEEICQFKAIVKIVDMVMTFPELCHSCGGCMAACPEGAITEAKREIGVIKTGAKNGIRFIHGELRIGEAMAPPLIRQVRSYIQTDMVNIIDAPPGTSCPVIAAMQKTDFVLLVTEPTPFGLNDLNLAVQAVKILGVPCGLVINRSDIGDEKVKTFAREENVPVLMEIPFDRKIAEIYSRGGMWVEEIPEWKEKFLELYEKIANLKDEQNK